MYILQYIVRVAILSGRYPRALWRFICVELQRAFIAVLVKNVSLFYILFLTNENLDIKGFRMALFG